MPRRRPYTQTVRQQKTEETRQRIVDALIELHQEIGPNQTTVAAIAERAGVQRLTVYRHFPDESAMLEACSSHFLTLHPPPDFSKWDVSRASDRFIRQGLTELYDYYASISPMLDRLNRDAPDNPILLNVMNRFGDYFTQLAQALQKALEGEVRRSATENTCLHIVQFTTWQSLDRLGLNSKAKAKLALQWLDGVSVRK